MTAENPTADHATAESTLDWLESTALSSQQGSPQGGEPRSLARFLWIDAETGDELSVDVRGSESFFEGLENLGFERIVDGTEDPRRSGRSRLCARVDVHSSSGNGGHPSSGGGRAWRARRGA